MTDNGAYPPGCTQQDHDDYWGREEDPTPEEQEEQARYEMGIGDL